MIFCLIFIFIFSRYETRNEAERCINTLQNIFLHRRKLLIDWDAGFVEGRQYRRRFSRNYQRTNQAISSSNKVISTAICAFVSIYKILNFDPVADLKYI